MTEVHPVITDIILKKIDLTNSMPLISSVQVLVKKNWSLLIVKKAKKNIFNITFITARWVG